MIEFGDDGADGQVVNDNPVVASLPKNFIISSDRSSYSDSGLLYNVRRPLFEISSISANIFSFSFWELNADW